MLLRIFPEPRYKTKQHTQKSKKDNTTQHWTKKKYIIYNNKKHTQTFSHKSSKKKYEKDKTKQYRHKQYRKQQINRKQTIN